MLAIGPEQAIAFGVLLSQHHIIGWIYRFWDEEPGLDLLALQFLDDFNRSLKLFVVCVLEL